MLRSRIAPTPSGYLHFGNAFSFLLTSLIVKKNNGRLLLRIDDIDEERKRPEYVNDIFASLDWLGIEWQEGPSGPEDFEKNWSQHHRIGNYRAMLNELVAAGIVFACACSRKKLASHQGGAYPGTCDQLRIPLNAPETSWRAHVPPNRTVRFYDEARGETEFPLGEYSGSFVVRKKDGLPSYQLASLADDVHFDINYIVRGEDLLSSTASQLYLAQKLNIESFQRARLLHHKLEKDEQGNKLSKSAGSISLQYMRSHDIPVSQIYKVFAQQFLGLQNQRISTFRELFDVYMNITA